MSNTQQAGIGRSSAIIASGTVVSRLLGFASGVVLGQTLGSVGTGANTFALANSLPNNIALIIAAGLFNAIFVPAIVRAALHDDGGTRFINRLVTLGVVVFIAIGIVATVAAPLLVTVYAAFGSRGDHGFSSADLALATGFAYWCLPQVLFYALYSLLGEVLNARGLYGPFSWAPAINNIVVIIGLIAFNMLFGSGAGTVGATEWTPEMVAVLAGSATLGVAIQAFSLCFFWRRAGLRYRPDFHWRGAGLGSAGRAAAWTLAMITITQLAGLVQTNVAGIAANHDEQNASIAAMKFAFLIFMLPHSIVAIPITTAYFTRMSAAARDNRFEDVRSDITAALLQIGAVIVFASIGLMVLAFPFAALFSKPANVAPMAWVLIAFLFGLLPLSVHYVLRRMFYAMEDTKTPFFITLFQAALFVIGALLVAQLPTSLIAIGLAVVTSVAAIAQALLAFVIVRRRIGTLDVEHIIRRNLLFLGATLPAAAIGLAIVWALGAFTGGFAVSSLIGAFVTLAAAGVPMVLIYGGILLLVRNPEAMGLVSPLVRRLRR